ncbi:hypothetical protein EVAR_166_1 [Eumeta japonica]|uniref:Uncharacterized protein n=1 Tax=Eumeta variegata TaxID=151549 RepID=A0A4C1SC02_EUMVA|nr:hypothetical protein EVAR_166_1 [Eumeta japonica]
MTTQRLSSHLWMTTIASSTQTLIGQRRGHKDTSTSVSYERTVEGILQRQSGPNKARRVAGAAACTLADVGGGDVWRDRENQQHAIHTRVSKTFT